MRTHDDTRRLVQALLEDDAREQLQRQADEDLTSALAEQWYGRAQVEEERRRFGPREALLALELRRAERLATVLNSDEHRTTVAHLETLQAALDTERAQWREAQDAQLQADRQALVIAKAAELRREYLALSDRLYRIDPRHPALPTSLQRWIHQRRAKRQLLDDDNRLLVYLVCQDSKLHAFNFSILPERALTLSQLEQVGEPPRNSREERLQRVLDQQFVHPNGDRRVAEDQGWGRGQAYVFQPPPNLPTLRALQGPQNCCATCGAEYRDRPRLVLDTHLLDTLGADGILPADLRWQAAVAVETVVFECECHAQVLDTQPLPPATGQEASWDAYQTALTAGRARLRQYWDTHPTRAVAA